jgi:hypothetical protein
VTVKLRPEVLDALDSRASAMGLSRHAFLVATLTEAAFPPVQVEIAVEPEAPPEPDVWSETEPRRHWHRFNQPVEDSMDYRGGSPWAFHRCECGQISDKREKVRGGQ